MFFDDNVKERDAHIVDLRDEQTDQPLAFEDTEGKFVVRVVPFEMLLDDRYYIEALRACESRSQNSGMGSQATD